MRKGYGSSPYFHYQNDDTSQLTEWLEILKGFSNISDEKFIYRSAGTSYMREWKVSLVSTMVIKMSDKWGSHPEYVSITSVDTFQNKLDRHQSESGRVYAEKYSLVKVMS